MGLTFVLVVGLTFVCASSHELRISNGCSFTVWVGLLNNPDKALPNNGGFQLDQGATQSVNVDNGWAGRVWGRTNCDANGQCETGDCGGKIECGGAGGNPPVSLAEITFDGDGGKDFYDISLVDGYNLPIAMEPIQGTTSGGGSSKYDCGRAGCTKDLNAQCPDELAQKNGEGNTVACKSACLAFNTDQYCCRGQYGTPETCKSTDWPTNYPATFKDACPDAYSYAYDDTTSTFTCSSSDGGSSGYSITFCP